MELPKRPIAPSNLFMESMDCEQRCEIEAIKKNKAFFRRLANNLGEVFHIFGRIVDEQKSSKYNMSTQAGSRHSSAYFKADKDGVIFHAHPLLMRERGKQPTQELYDRYKDTGECSADKSYMSEYGHGNVTFDIKLSEDDPNLQQKLKDIMFIMERKYFNRKF